MSAIWQRLRGRQSTVEVVVYNTNQFVSTTLQAGAILDIMDRTDVEIILLTECYKVTVHNLLRPGWGYVQDLTDDGTKNVAILYRLHVQAKWSGIIQILPPGKGLRGRWLAYLHIPGGTFAITHRPPERDKDEWVLFDANVGTFAYRHPKALIGLDSNASTKAQRQRMEAHVERPFVGVGIIGALTRLRVTNVHALPMLSSDHPPVQMTVHL